ncbi:molybdopterin-dependent oxidoreductase [Aliiroseovarius sp. Z3]|uniref:molybdopterin-dependent oxidoreductase n=1 Tax=Aliiroseovarius sp. Z3 TaxID=2811402 RepID=UPI0023B20AF2|nr:molybdopterin-dependent oxidoreductase [Aliiroseovarius sp. Z3]MDE9450231.1 molybdopterin-dependent oxidoreductase [Aliiroseovarius sp. Z3]
MTFIMRVFAVSALAALPSGVFAQDVVLTVTHGGEVTEFDMPALEAMEAQEFETTTIWTEGLQTFTGVSLAALLDDFGVTEGAIKATAINDYAVEIPVDDAIEGGPIIAYRLNGDPMSVRDKGPLWVVYPYDSDKAYQTEIIYSRSIWQLDRIDVIE